MTASRLQATRRTRRLLAASVAVLVAAAMVVSVAEGTARTLPGVALGSPVLLHAERVLVLVGVVIAAASVLAQAARGRLPIALSTPGCATKPRPPTTPRPPWRSCRTSSTTSSRPSTRSPTDSTFRNDARIEERDGHPADNRTAAARLRSRARQGVAGAQRASPRRGPAVC